MRPHVIFAIFRRNFVSYFSSPLGYLFICAFVLMTAVAAFWPNEFFNRNLANLDTLNAAVPWILLVFIPAITMSIWADERRQGTDEVLLTMPATDLEVVLGKFKAALAIYLVSLLFSVSNVIVLAGLGDPDLGLLFANYLGYFLAGAAMLSVGMAASFLTGNLTVGFVLGAVFNMPLVFATYADAILPSESISRAIQGLSIGAQLEDFSRGLITFSGLAYHAVIIAVMLYGAMILVGRRHWSGQSAQTAAGGREPISLGPQYALRFLAVAAVGISVLVITTRFDVRVDTTAERLSSLEPETKELLANLDADRPVFIDAYISPTVPEAYVQTRLNLLATLREVDRRGGDAVVVRINDTERFSTAAAEAEEQFGIVPRDVQAERGGTISVEAIHLGLAFQSGLDKIVVPFVDRGIPVRYEVVRSIATVSQQERKRVGVLVTDATLFGGFDMQTMSSRPDQPLLQDLRRQYEVVRVDPAQPIETNLDALLAVQPSSLPQPALDNFLAAVRAGVPTAIFEDPVPYLDAGTPGTDEPRRPPGGGNPFMQQPPPEPKGSILGLWGLLGAQIDTTTIVWDDYNPYPKIQGFDPEFIFTGRGSGVDDALARDAAATKDLEQIVFLYAGSIRPLPGATVAMEPLVKTGLETGTVNTSEIFTRNIFGGTQLNPYRKHTPTRQSYVLSAHFTGTPTGEGATPINVVLTADTDVLQSAFFNIRAAGTTRQAPVQFQFDNVAYVLNVLDELAGDDRFIRMRSRRPQHRTLTAVEARTEEATRRANDARQTFLTEFETQRQAEQAKLDEAVAALRAQEGIDQRQLDLQVAMQQRVGSNRLEAELERLERERDRNLDRIERNLALEVRGVQNVYKLAAVGLSPIPPLVIAIIVFLRRRAQERIGVPAARLRGA